MLNSNDSFERDSANQEQEIYSAALWAKQQLQQYPHAKIGCIIPNLKQYYLQILDAFTEVLLPESLVPGNTDPLPFHILMKRPLSDYPIINIALLALSLDSLVNPTLSINRLLLSPFIGTDDSLIQHAQLDAELRSHFETYIFTSKLPGFISKALTTLDSLASEQRLSFWVKQFTEQLQQLGWPGFRRLNHEESQTLERWQTLFSELSRLETGGALPLFTREQALGHLIHLSNATFYQPLPQHSPSIQVFESLEETEHHINPKHLYLIKAEPDRLELESSIELTYANSIYQSRQIEMISDSNGPAVHSQEAIRGGSDILKQQAACPFKAFAKHRLYAREIAPQQLGLHPMERGQILHLILEQLWHHLKDHQHLCTLTDDNIDETIYSSIDTALNHFQNHKPYTFKKQFITIERQRLLKLLKKWLAIEKARPPFKVIAKELRQKTKLKHLDLNLQIDRIDELEDGSYIIIDYKTGQVTINDWLGDRPNEPQLPLYCVTHPTPIAAILFAQIRSNQMRLIELSPQQAQWKTTLLNLEKDFCDGNALVDPKYGNQTCNQCTFQTLCRISEKSK